MIGRGHAITRGGGRQTFGRAFAVGTDGPVQRERPDGSLVCNNAAVPCARAAQRIRYRAGECRKRARIRKRRIAETIDMQRLISYVDSSSVEWFQFRPGSRWKTLFEDRKTGQRAILVQWDPGYHMGQVDRHDRDEIVSCSRARLCRMAAHRAPAHTFITVQARAIKLRRPTAALFSRSSRGSGPDKGALRRSNWRGFATCRDALRRRCPRRVLQSTIAYDRFAKLSLRGRLVFRKPVGSLGTFCVAPGDHSRRERSDRKNNST